MNARKYFFLGALSLMGAASFEEGLQAGPRKRRMESPIAYAAPSMLLPPVEAGAVPFASPHGVVTIRATGETLTQPKVLLYPTLTKLQRIGDLIEHGKDPVR